MQYYLPILYHLEVFCLIFLHIIWIEQVLYLRKFCAEGKWSKLIEWIKIICGLSMILWKFDHKCQICHYFLYFLNEKHLCAFSNGVFQKQFSTKFTLVIFVTFMNYVEIFLQIGWCRKYFTTTFTFVVIFESFMNCMNRFL